MNKTSPGLITHCICGGDEFIQFIKVGDSNGNFLIEECLNCGVKHQRVQLTYDEYISTYYKEYSSFEGKNGGPLASQERYTHDYTLAGKRMDEYEKILPKGSSVLDIGSGNGAFVDCFHNWGYNIKGLEFCREHKLSKADYQGDFMELNLRGLRFDAVTMHDVLEHFVDPLEALKKCFFLLKNKGILIIDFPDFFHLEGLHHWKRIEHLWMFTKVELFSLITKIGFHVFDQYKPIPSKLVFYAKKL